MAKAVFLEFEKELGEIAGKIDALETVALETGTNPRSEIARLERELVQRTAELYAELTPWQCSLVARHPNRPYTMDYINSIFEDFTELHGDRVYADDESIVGGLARLGQYSVMVIGHQKGRDTRERTRRNFGMSRPEGYRKALRLMKLAEKFNLPVFTFVDTPGAYPGIGAEERNQSEAIGRNLFELSKLRVPVISTIIGEGGSGGALAIAVADVVMMLQYSTYSVISPEGCASILWKDAGKASTAAEALGLTADTLLQLGLVDKVVSEPLGGAHRDPRLMASTLKKALIDQLRAMLALPVDELLERRLSRLMNYGRYAIDENLVKQPEPAPAPAIEDAAIVSENAEPETIDEKAEPKSEDKV
ncbi:MAG: acetyl-CoA carboxylase carboxyltransferase subunit alpha [Duodenibacillus sp.]|nr:acetyl-CoA carboxylase carboxyltransferase subunit alpha [Duodenibacillus sp.]